MEAKIKPEGRGFLSAGVVTKGSLEVIPNYKQTEFSPSFGFAFYLREIVFPLIALKGGHLKAWLE